MTDFETRDIVVRGYTLTVSCDGTITLPRKETTYSYVRLGQPATKTAIFKERIRKPSLTALGYLEVCFQHKRKTFKFLVHRLVAMAFVDGYAEDLTVNHINGVKTDNRPENLEWISRAENTAHAWKAGLVPLIGEANPGAKLDERRVRYIRRLLDQGVPAHALAVVAGVSDSLVTKIRDGERWAHVC